MFKKIKQIHILKRITMMQDLNLSENNNDILRHYLTLLYVI